MKIIIPVIGFGRAGGQRVLSKLADQFILHGHEVTFVAPSTDSIPYYSTNATVFQAKTKVSKFSFLTLFYKIYSVWRETLKFEGGCIIANHNLTAYIAFFLPKKFKKYYYVQAYEVKISKNKVLKIIAYFSYFLNIPKVVNSACILPSLFNKNLGVVPAGVDTALYKTNINTYSKEKIIKIGCVGREQKYKGTQEIIDAFISLSSKYNIILNVAVYLPEIPSSIVDRVNFFPIASDIELAEFYKQNDIIVATGLIEDGAFHYPCAEGMAASKVVISNYEPLVKLTNVNQSPLILNDVNTAKIEQALEIAINLSETGQISEINRNEAVMDEYSWEKIGKKFLSILELK